MGALDLFRRKPQTAAVVRVLQPEVMSKGMQQTREVAEAWLAYRLLGEVGYVVNQQARLIGRLDWTMTLNGGDPIDTEKSDELLRAAFGENLDDLATKAGQCIQVAGAYVLARTVASDPNSWRVFSSPLSAKNRKRVEASDVVVEVRIEDPEDDSRNDSTVLRAMDTCRELILARAQSRAWSRNRTAQLGLLLYPSEGVKDQETFNADIQDTITAPLSDERTTASVTPSIIGFPAEYIEKWKMLDLSGDADETLDTKIDRLVRALAVQLDAPPEVLLGFGDSNHWNQWATQEDNWVGHIQPEAKPIGAGFAAALMKVTDTTGICLEPDAGPLMVRRPTTTDALAAQAAGLVSDEWTREQLGADETDAPAAVPTDPAITAALDLVKNAPSLAQDPGIPAVVQQIRDVLAGKAYVAPIAAPASVAPASAEPKAIAAALRGRMPQAAAGKHIDGRTLAAIDTQAYDSTEDLINDTAERALERLGAKVRSMSRTPGLEIPEGVSNADLAVSFQGQIPNADAAIADTITATLPKLDRIVTRAFARLRSMGLDLAVDPEDAESVRSLYAVLVSGVVADRLVGLPTTASTWQASRRIVAVAGGRGDTAVAS